FVYSEGSIDHQRVCGRQKPILTKRLAIIKYLLSSAPCPTLPRIRLLTFPLHSGSSAFGGFDPLEVNCSTRFAPLRLSSIASIVKHDNNRYFQTTVRLFAESTHYKLNISLGGFLMRSFLEHIAI
ncbi:MAG: hypothetical protein MHMPM18_002702, partial [Marteilia pararefringens]